MINMAVQIVGDNQPPFQPKADKVNAIFTIVAMVIQPRYKLIG